MVKLKTLKDFEGEEDNAWNGGYETCKNHLRDEAIKWIKADKSNYYSRQGKEETILWIKNFFNITDEDLK